MSKVAKVKEAVKETLVGSEESEPALLSVQTKARFNSHAIKDAETGELFLGPDEFINAVAPPDEDYVSQCFPARMRRTCFVDSNLRVTNSTRSSVSSTRSSFASPTEKTRARLPSPTGVTLRTS